MSEKDSTLLDAGKEELDKLILILNEHKLYIDEIEITGHTATSLVEYNAISISSLTSSWVIGISLPSSASLSPSGPRGKSSTLISASASVTRRKCSAS